MPKPKFTKLKMKRTRNAEQNKMLIAVRSYFAYQKMRISVNNQVDSMLRRALIDEDQANQHRHEWCKGFEEAENEVKGAMTTHLEGCEIWKQWLTHVGGIGPVLAAQVIALIQPVSDFATVSKLWKYAGYGVTNGKGDGFQEGQQPHHCEDLKRVGYLIGDSFIKHRSAYREFYDRRKEYETKRMTDDDELSKMQVHRRAMRYMIKHFLSHLWVAMRELEGLPTTKPYVIDQLAHQHYVGPWQMTDLPRVEPAST